MQYRKIVSGNTVIEFHNNWLGEETVIANGQLVSKKSSIMGTSHFFNVIENRNQVRYMLRTRVSNNMAVVLDLKRNGVYLEEGISVSINFGSGKTLNRSKKHGLIKLKEYDLDAALEDFKKGLDEDPRDPEIYFHMACAYSIQEKTKDGFESMRKAVELKLADKEKILSHDMLAFLRMHPAFEDFVNSNFTTFDEKLIDDNDNDSL